MADAVRVRDVVHSVVAEIAPDELPALEALETLDDETIVRRLKKHSSSRAPLGFGIAAITVMVTPVVWIVLDEAIRNATERLGKRFLGRWRKAKPRVLVPLSEEQLKRVHERVIEVAGARGVGAEQAEIIAEGVVARLVLAQGDDEAIG